MIITVENVTTDCLNSISYKIEKGLSYKIITNSDIERKILLDIMLGFQRPRSGRIVIFGKEIYSINEKVFENLCKNIAVVWRYGGLLSSLTAWDNIILPIKYHRINELKEAEDKAIHLCREVGIDVSRNSGYLGKPTGPLPIHERRLISLIRAFIIEPDLIMYDSLFEGFDQKLIDKLVQLTSEFNTQKPDRTSIFIHSDSEETYSKDLKVDIVLRQTGERFITT